MSPFFVAVNANHTVPVRKPHIRRDGIVKGCFIHAFAVLVVIQVQAYDRLVEHDDKQLQGASLNGLLAAWHDISEVWQDVLVLRRFPDLRRRSNAARSR